MKVEYRNNDINLVFEHATNFVRDYQSIMQTKTLKDIKVWLVPFLSKNNLRLIEAGVLIGKKDFNIAVICLFGFISVIIMTS